MSKEVEKDVFVVLIDNQSEVLPKKTRASFQVGSHKKILFKKTCTAGDEKS